MKKKRVALIIIDGWALGSGDPSVDATAKANTPFLDALKDKYSCCRLKTSGYEVGLPEGQMGNSEVGHLNIGAGRVVYQPLVRINKAFNDQTAGQNPRLQEAFRYAKAQNKKVHLIGLVSDGGIHSSNSHLYGLCTAARDADLQNVYIHAFTDGRDTNTHEGKRYLSELQEHLDKTTGRIASVVGRYYAMDRDKRWERIKKAYDLMVHGKGKPFSNALNAVQDAYDAGITDEFIEPCVITGENDRPLATFDEGDVVINFNFRTDRCRQITEVLTQHDMPEHGMKTVAVRYMTMTEYDPEYKNVSVLFKFEPTKMSLGEVVSNAGKKQLRIAETEKYPHVTYFFSGGREQPFSGENRIMVPSPKVPTYDMQPEMNAPELTRKVTGAIGEEQYDLIVLNFANPDMVGHTGDFDAVVKAMEAIDECARKVVEKALEKDYCCIVTSDHGNAEYLVNDDGTPNTAHTTNPVPLYIVDAEGTFTKKMQSHNSSDSGVGTAGGKGYTKLMESGRLGNIAPTILYLMGIPKPVEMEEKSLIVNY